MKKKTKTVYTKKPKRKEKNTDKGSVKSTIAKSDDGTIQVTFTIPHTKIAKSKDKAIEELSKTIEVPGFRKGNAPMDKVLSHIPQNTLVEKTLSSILPSIFGDAIDEHKIRPAVYPKFELIKAEEGQDWEVRATTCELPDIQLGNYKELIKGASKTKAIWTPEKGGADDDKKDAQREPTKGEKEQEVIKILIENVQVKVPKMLIEEEVNARLSKLLQRIEKLGLTLDSYLASLGKTAPQMRSEYEKQAEDAIKFDFALNKIAEVEKIEVTNEQVNTAISASSTADPNMAEQLNTPEQRRVIESALKRRASLDFLISLL